MKALLLPQHDVLHSQETKKEGCVFVKGKHGKVVDKVKGLHMPSRKVTCWKNFVGMLPLL